MRLRTTLVICCAVGWLLLLVALLTGHQRPGLMAAVWMMSLLLLAVIFDRGLFIDAHAVRCPRCSRIVRTADAPAYQLCHRCQ